MRNRIVRYTKKYNVAFNEGTFAQFGKIIPPLRLWMRQPIIPTLFLEWEVVAIYETQALLPRLVL